MLRQVVRNLGIAKQAHQLGMVSARQSSSHYPINEDLFGLNEDQRAVMSYIEIEDHYVHYAFVTAPKDGV